MTLAAPASRVPHRIQRRRTRGWRKPEDAIVVTRPTMWGNPFYVGRRTYSHPVQPGSPHIVTTLTAEQAVRLYRMWFVQDTWPDGTRNMQRTQLHRLAGRDLVCWCKLGEPCHADFLLSVANAPDPAKMLAARTRAIYDYRIKTRDADAALSWVIHPLTWRAISDSYRWARLIDPGAAGLLHVPRRIFPGMRLFGMEVTEGIDCNGFKVVRTG